MISRRAWIARCTSHSSMVATFGPFQLLRALGVGELGEVYVARTPWRGNPCAAVKRLRTERTSSLVFVERFRRSMRVAKAIDHANLVPLFDSGAIDGTYYTCSQLVPGHNVVAISDRLAQHGVGAPMLVCLRVLLDMLSALARIEGLVEHGGLPRNVIIGWDGYARLSDLGLPRDSRIPDLVGLGLAIHRLLVGHESGELLGKVRPDLPDWFTELIGDLISGTAIDAPVLFHAVMTRAFAEGDMIPHSAVAEWLAELFSAEQRVMPGFVDSRVPGAWSRAVSKTEDEAAW